MVAPDEPEPLTNVLLLNDDFTPMEFVVDVLQRCFDKDRETATELMLTIHHDGVAACGAYPSEVAEQKQRAVLALAREYQHPLQCTVERADKPIAKPRLTLPGYHGNKMAMDVERIQTGVRLERRLVKVLKALAEYLDISLGDLLEGVALHAFEGRAPFSPQTLGVIAELKRVYGLNLKADDSHGLREKGEGADGAY